MEVIKEAVTGSTKEKDVAPRRTSPPAQDKYAVIDEARRVLRGEFRSTIQLGELSRRLEHFDQFAYAAEVLLLKMDHDRKNGHAVTKEESQALVRYIYNDTSLASVFRFDRALKELEQLDHLSITENLETLGLAGTIYKRKWMYDHQNSNLDRAHFYYERGFASWKRFISSSDTAPPEWNDGGYTAINYAYILQLKAANLLEQMKDIPEAVQLAGDLLEKSRQVRYTIINHYASQTDALEFSVRPFVNPDKNTPWVAAILAEAYFGLSYYEESMKYIRLHLDAAKDDELRFVTDQQVRWKIRTLALQLASLANLQLSIRNFDFDRGSVRHERLKEFAADVDNQKIVAALSLLTGAATDTKTGINMQRVGLSLSGGGFRASLYHIGVLTALAEQDKLKDVEVLSCVSGGSIIGAFYYLKLKRLLETKRDADINREDYISLIADVQYEFLAGVQKNIRMRVMSNLWCNLKMMTQTYSRTHRLGELYEEHFFQSQFQGGEGPVFMHDLFILPKGMEDFSMPVDNWRRRNKVPQLIINSTSVNTGHNFQFTASWMGEPPSPILIDVDVKPRLRRMYYKDAPEAYKNFRLGYAVAASSCVPVLFDPMPMFGLYEQKGVEIGLQLIDGGLHDNQGISALLEQECNNVIISDASGQLPLSTTGSPNELSVFYRADSILQERLRELQFGDLMERKNTTQIAGLMCMHLKSGLHSPSVSWRFCDDPPRKMYNEKVRDESSLTEAGILRGMQELLSEVRTDLDCFHDTEAFALMYTGYAQTNNELKKGGNMAYETGLIDWRFLSVREMLTRSEKADEMRKLLSVSRRIVLKVFFVSKPAFMFAVMVGLVSILALVLSVENFPGAKIQVTVKGIAFSLLLVGLGIVSNWLAALVDIRSFIKKKVLFALLALWGFIGCNVYLALFNHWYKQAGKISNKD